MRADTLLLVRSKIEIGESDQSIADELDLNLEDIREYRDRVYSDELSEVRHRSPDEIYADYRIRMFAIAKDLGDLATDIREAGDSKGFNAAANALKSKATIIDKVIDRGQEMGVIPRAAKRNIVIGGVTVAAATDGELIQMMSEQATEAKRLSSFYGDTAMTALPEPEVYKGKSFGEVIDITVTEESKKHRRPERRKVT